MLPMESTPSVPMTTPKVINLFLSNATQGTARTYGFTLRSFFGMVGKDFREITLFDALAYDQHLKATVGKATVQRKISTLKTFFTFCIHAELIDKNPFAIVKQSAATNRAAEKFLVVTEIERLLTALKETGEREFILGLLLASTGMRISEVHQLSWCDFIEMIDGSISVNALRKGDERQLLALRDDVWQAVKAYMGREINQFDQSPLFLNPSGERASTVSLRNWIEAAAVRAKITKKVTPHWLRHSFATITLNSGADIRDLMVYMNHKNLSTTQIYAHPQNAKVAEFMDLGIKKNEE